MRPRTVLALSSLLTLSAFAFACGGPREEVSSTDGPGVGTGDEALADEVVPVEQSTGAMPDCATSQAYIQRTATGYEHIVRIDNECDEEVRCEVTTDVAPEPVFGRVFPHDQAALTTYRGGQTSSFTPSVSCETL